MSSDSIGQLVYLLLLGVVVGGWFFAQNRQRLNKTLQQAILWSFLFAGAIILYGLKDSLRQQLMPVNMTQLGGQKIALRRASDRHFYARLEINGVAVDFVVDTGATNLVLSRQDARRVGIDPDKLAYYLTAQTANGTVRTARVTLDEVRFGPFTDHKVRAWVNDGEMQGSLLGMSYLSRFSNIQISGNTMTLSR